MKFINITINPDGTTDYFEQHLAYQFEHNSTTLRFQFPEEYKNPNYFYYPCFKFNSNQEFISRIPSAVDKFEWVVPSFVTKEAGPIFMTVIIKDLQENTILTTESISLYIEKAEFNPDNFNDNSTDPNIQIWLDQMDKLFIEVRNVDARISALTNEDGIVEVIDARGEYSSLKLHLESIKSQIETLKINIQNEIKLNSTNLINQINAKPNNYPGIESNPPNDVLDAWKPNDFYVQYT